MISMVMCLKFLLHVFLCKKMTLHCFHRQLRDLEMEKRDPRTVVAIILGGGAGTRLFPLTKRRAKPAVSL